MAVKRLKIISDKDKGFKSVIRLLQSTPTYADVGITKTETRDDSTLTNVQIGHTHEYGSISRRIPQRSFIGSTIDEKETSYWRELFGIGQGALPPTQVPIGVALNEFGDDVKQDIEDTIRSNVPPPLSPLTIEKKGHDLALIDTMQLMDSLDSDVHK